MSDDNKQITTSIGRRIDALNQTIGHAAAWLCLAMVVVTFVIVLLRYAFDVGFIWLQETLIWMHAAVFMLGAAYTFLKDEHVRVDIFYRQMSARKKAWVNAAGVVLFILPLCGFLLLEAWDYVVNAWRIREVSRDTGGLPYPAIPLLKSLLIAMPLLVALQGIAVFLSAVKTLRMTGARS